MNICEQSGIEIDIQPNWKFCPICGMKLEKKELEK